MNSDHQERDHGVITITNADAASSHVDDLLARQMSLRGEEGISRSGRRSWYYQNWFLFMIAGGLAAFASWALMEPFFDDMSFVQGAIQEVEMEGNNFAGADADLILSAFGVETMGWIKVNEEMISIHTGTQSSLEEGGYGFLDPNDLQPGRQVGVYVETIEYPGAPLAIAGYIELNPSQPAPAKALLSLETQSTRQLTASLLLFGVVAGFIGLAIGATDGIVCRLFRRALVAGGVGLAVGLVGGLLSTILAGIAYMPLNAFAMEQMDTADGSFSTFGFIVQMWGRALAWGLAGMTMGLGQGIALRSKRLLLYGFLGGIIGGLLGGLSFDPVDMIILDGDAPSAHWSRMIGITLIGTTVGLMIGIVELLARDAWLRMLEGPLAGKEFLLFKDSMRIGASPRSDIYLFNDKEVAENHAVLRVSGDVYEIESARPDKNVLLNQRPTTRSRLRPGDRITIGRTVFVFEQRRR